MSAAKAALNLWVTAGLKPSPDTRKIKIKSQILNQKQNQILNLVSGKCPVLGKSHPNLAKNARLGWSTRPFSNRAQLWGKPHDTRLEEGSEAVALVPGIGFAWD